MHQKIVNEKIAFSQKIVYYDYLGIRRSASFPSHNFGLEGMIKEIPYQINNTTTTNPIEETYKDHMLNVCVNRNYIIPPGVYQQNFCGQSIKTFGIKCLATILGRLH